MEKERPWNSAGLPAKGSRKWQEIKGQGQTNQGLSATAEEFWFYAEVHELWL